jgi:hypothetical protein
MNAADHNICLPVVTSDLFCSKGSETILTRLRARYRELLMHELREQFPGSDLRAEALYFFRALSAER